MLHENLDKQGERKMYRMLLEVSCPKHGFERYSIKILKKYNIPSKDIAPRFSKLKPKEISRLYVGRDVTKKEIEVFVNDYFSQIGMREMILKMRIPKII